MQSWSLNVKIISKKTPSLYPQQQVQENYSPGSECFPWLSPSNTRSQNTWWAVFSQIYRRVKQLWMISSLYYRLNFSRILHWPHVRYLIYGQVGPPGIVDLILAGKIFTIATLQCCSLFEHTIPYNSKNVCVECFPKSHDKSVNHQNHKNLCQRGIFVENIQCE